MASQAPTAIELERKPSLLQRLLPSCANFGGTRRHWRAKERCVDEPWPASVIRLKSTHPAIAQCHQATKFRWSPVRNAGDNWRVTIEALPITVTSIAKQPVGLTHEVTETENKAIDQTPSSCRTATNTVKGLPIAPQRSSLGSKQLQSTPVATSRHASRPSSASTSTATNKAEKERNANPFILTCKPAVCHPRPPRDSKQTATDLECRDDSFPYPSPFPIPPSQSNIAEKFEQRISELARLQRETVLYERHKRQSRHLHRSVSKQSLTKASSNASQSKGKRSEKRGSCTSLDAFSNVALTQRRQLSSASTPQLSTQHRRHSVSSKSNQSSNTSKLKAHRRSTRRHSVVS